MAYYAECKMPSLQTMPKYCNQNTKQHNMALTVHLIKEVIYSHNWIDISFLFSKCLGGPKSVLGYCHSYSRGTENAHDLK